MYCIHCGVQNVDDANFCLNCGRELRPSPAEEVVEPRTDESQSEVRVHHPWMRAQQQPQEQVKEESQQQLQEEARQIHHPWMAAQEQSHEQVQEESEEKHQAQDQGEVPNAVKSVLSRINGWSTKKKILWGIVAGFLFLVCVGVIFGEPVEDGAESTELKPTNTPTHKDRLAGKHCMQEFQTISTSLIRAEMRSPIIKYAGFDPSTLKMTDYKIAPLDHELTALFEQEYNAYGGVWPGQKKHAAIAEFTAEHVDRGKGRYRAVFWARNDNCDVVLLDMARAR